MGIEQWDMVRSGSEFPYNQCMLRPDIYVVLP